MARFTTDVEQLFHDILSATLSGVDVMPEVDVDSIDHLPLLLLTADNGAMISNGNPAFGWEWVLGLTLLANDRETGNDLADEVYKTVHYSEGTVIDGVGGVSSVEDQNMFSRGTTVTGDPSLGSIVPFTASFTVRVRPAWAPDARVI